MATRRQECSICMDSFKSPKLIPCHHSFCHKCLEDYVRANLRNGRFDCPLCRTSVELPKGGVSGFQSNFYIDTDNDEQFACDLCGPKSIACGRCLDCEENLCQSCCHAHEKSKASKHHKISDLGTLDLEMKGKIRQRIFCDKHSEEEIKLVCQKCNSAICVLCKVLNHDTHASKTVADAAAVVQQSLEAKLNKCTEKLRRLDVCFQMGVDLERMIDDAEREEINAFDKQYSRVLRALDEEAAKLKAKITSIYDELREKNKAFKVDVKEEIKMCSNANETVQAIVTEGTNFEKIQKGPDLERLITKATSKTDPIVTLSLERKFFSPAAVKTNELISLIGVVEDCTNLSPSEDRANARSYKVNKREVETVMNFV
ncbi:hypothetical protein CHS0354_025699 [Potamilus streckersoni]|uniref:Uncharacterized protein n=1 Tax=Potamilus streckersoni TaxID=2493646 RepID=A0AAE0S1E0_9BIVA|nr:hypothetical protein CHS0354_025699 [Potamilus streckersoni]